MVKAGCDMVSHLTFHSHSDQPEATISSICSTVMRQCLSSPDANTATTTIQAGCDTHIIINRTTAT